MVQLSQLYMTTGKAIALLANDVSAFYLLSGFVIAFLPRSKHLLMSWIQSVSAVLLESKKIKSVTVSTFSPFVCHEVIGLDAMISFLKVEL